MATEDTVTKPQAKNGTKEAAAELNKDEKAWVCALLGTAGVCSLLTTVGDKVMAANIQAKLGE